MNVVGRGGLISHGNADSKVELVPFEPWMADTIASWVDSRETQFRWTAHSLPFPVTGDALRDLSAGHLQDGHRQVYAARRCQSGDVVGYVELVFDPDNYSARIGRMIVGPPAERGQGTGTAVLRAVLNEARTARGAHRVDLLVASDNAPAIACYTRVGFEVEGVMRDARYFDGIFRSMLLMSILGGVKG